MQTSSLVQDEALQRLVDAGIRIVVKAPRPPTVEHWNWHPEIAGGFMEAGGATPLFPTTGMEAEAICANPFSQFGMPPYYEKGGIVIIEEFFHTLQYTAMSALQQCQYHNAYNNCPLLHRIADKVCGDFAERIFVCKPYTAHQKRNDI